MLLKFAEMLGLSPDAVTLILTIGTLVLTIAHARGNEMPILSNILRLLGAKVPAPPARPAEPDAPLPALGEGRLLELLRRAIRDELPKIVKETDVRPA